MARRCPSRSSGSCRATSSSISSISPPSHHWCWALASVALGRSMDWPAGAGGLDEGGVGTGRAGAPQLVSHLPVALAWAVAGVLTGAALNYVSRWLARIEEIEFRQSLPETLLMPALCALLFFLFA